MTEPYIKEVFPDDIRPDYVEVHTHIKHDVPLHQQHKLTKVVERAFDKSGKRKTRGGETVLLVRGKRLALMKREVEQCHNADSDGVLWFLRRIR